MKKSWRVGNLAIHAISSLLLTFTLVSHGADCVSPPPGVVSWWRGEGNAIDTIGTNNGILQGDLSFVAGEVGQSFSLNQTNASIKIPASSTLNIGASNGFTLEAWIKPTAVTNLQPLFEWNSGSTVGDAWGVHFYASVDPGPGALYANIVDSNQGWHRLSSTNTPLVANIFQHVALTYDKMSGIATIYCNGNIVARQAIGSFTPKTTYDLYLGRRITGEKFAYKGLIDEPAVYARALNQSEIQAVYNGGSAGKCAPTTISNCTPAPTNIVSWWRAEGNGNDDVSGNTAVLQSGVAFGSGKVGQAFLLNNTNAYAVVPPSPSLNVGQGSGFTIEGWINVTNVNGFHPICEWNDMTGNIGVALWMGTTPSSQGVLMGDPKTTNGLDNMIISPSGTLIANTWQHVALTYDKASGVGTIYVNGTIVGQQNIGSFTPQTSTTLVIGRRPTDRVGDWTYNTILGGALDELTLYSRALSQAEIQAIYNADSAGKCGLVAPLIVTPPSSRTNNAGTAASFSVKAGGTAPFSYQWNFEGSPIAGATNSTIILPNVQLSDAGNYSVLVTNLGGSVLSTDAVLTVVVPDCISAPTNLVSWWRAEGDAKDAMRLNNGVIEGSVTFSPGQVGEAFSLNETNTDIRIPASSTLDIGASNGFTLEAWINPFSITNLQPIFEWNSGNTVGDAWGVHFYVSVDPGPGSLYANVVDSAQGWHRISSTNRPVLAGVFQHVALTYDKIAGIATIYCNGRIVARGALGSFTPNTTYDLYLGRRPTGELFKYKGLIDEPGIYNRALSQMEIQSIYNAGVAGKCVPVYPPTITVQPTNAFAIAGSDVTFIGAATGTDPLSYQWAFNGSPIFGATNTSLTLSNVQNSDEGTYVLTVTNLYGSAISSNAALVVDVPPVANASATTPLVISVNNSNATVVLDGSLSSDADGDSLHYLWFDAQTNSIATGIVAVVTLPVATNTITLVVDDGYVSSSDSINVEVITIAQAVERLEGVVDSDVSKKNALVALLNAALAAIDRSDATAAVHQLQAFQDQVKAQLAPLDPTLAQSLSDEAQTIIDAITSGGTVHGQAALHASMQSNGRLHVKFSGAHQQTYIIEASTNLTDWEMVGVAKEQPDGTFDFDDTEAPQKTARFYRVIVP